MKMPNPSSTGAMSWDRPWDSPRVIPFRKRKTAMIPQELSIENPLGPLGYEAEDILAPGRFGSVLAHAGVGKTALLVQTALFLMRNGINVLHVSLQDPVHKVDLWYRELLQHLTERAGLRGNRQVWDVLQAFRFIMTIRVDGFSVPKFEERLNDLMIQNIFRPRILIIDGLHIDETSREVFCDLKALAAKSGVSAWFTVHAHRHEGRTADGLPPSFAQISDLFEMTLELLSEGSEIRLKAIKGANGASSGKDLELDPSTMLVRSA